MKKINLLIIGIILIIISFFVGRNYQSFQEKKNLKYEKLDSSQIEYILNQKAEEDKIKIETIKKKIIPKVEPIIETKRISNQEQTTPRPTTNAILKYKSSNFDFEDATDILYTKYETSYHTINFNNNTITLRSKLGKNEWKTLVYKWKDFNDPYGNGYIEFEIINDKTIYQIWRSKPNNFGYEMKQGTKYVFYDVTQIN